MESDNNPTLTKEQLKKIMAQYDVKFQREYLGTFLDEEEDPLLEVAETYERHCYFYDLKVCTSISPRSGEPIPSNWQEWTQINRHALQERRELMRRYCLTYPQFHQALVRYNNCYPYIHTYEEEESTRF